MRPMLSDVGVGGTLTGHGGKPAVYRVRTDYRSGVLEAKSEMERIAAASKPVRGPMQAAGAPKEKSRPDYAVILAAAVIVVLALVIAFLVIVISGYL